MATVELLARAARDGVHVEMRGDSLILVGPPACRAKWVDTLRLHKEAIRAALIKAARPPIKAANLKGVGGLNIPNTNQRLASDFRLRPPNPQVGGLNGLCDLGRQPVEVGGLNKKVAVSHCYKSDTLRPPTPANLGGLNPPLAALIEPPAAPPAAPEVRAPVVLKIDIEAHLRDAQRDADRKNLTATRAGTTDRWCRCGRYACLARPSPNGRDVWLCDRCAKREGFLT